MHVRRIFSARSWDAASCEQRVGLSLLIVLVAAPIGWAVGYAALYSFGLIGLLSQGATVQHWSAVLTSGLLLQSVLYSLSIAGVSTLLAVAAALLAVCLYPELRRSRFHMALLVIPLATPPTVIALVTYQWFNPGGVLARIAWACGTLKTPSDFPALVNDPWSIGLVIAQSATTFPLLVLFLLKSWTSSRIDRYCQLALSLGASERESRWQVALPMLVHRVRPLVLFTFLVNLGAYELPLILGRQAPQMFSVLTQRHFGQFDLTQRPQAFALALVYLALVSFGVLLLTSRRRCKR